jgi:hypothetical protein
MSNIFKTIFSLSLDTTSNFFFETMSNFLRTISRIAIGFWKQCPIFLKKKVLKLLFVFGSKVQFFQEKSLEFQFFYRSSLTYYNSVLIDYNSLCYKKIAAYKSEIRFDPSVPDLEIPHAIVGVNKLLKHFYTIHYDILCMTKYIIVHEFVCRTI